MHFCNVVWARHIYPSLVLDQPRKTRPCLTERLLMRRKESNQTKICNVVSNWNVAKIVSEYDQEIPQSQTADGRQISPLMHIALLRSEIEMSRDMRFPTMWYVRPAKAQTSLRIRTVCSEPLLVAWIFYECFTTDGTVFGVSRPKRRLHRLVWDYTCQNATLLEITCHGSLITSSFETIDQSAFHRYLWLLSVLTESFCSAKTS